MNEIAANITSQVDRLRDHGQNLFDESRFHFISSMVKRAEQERFSVALILQTKAAKLLAEYQSDLLLAEEEARIISSRIKLNFPDSDKQVDSLLKAYKVSALRQLESRLMRTQDSMLKALTNLLLVEDTESQIEPSFIDLLNNQETEVIKTFSTEPCHLPLGRNELRSARMYRESQEKLNAEKIIRMAIKSGPDNPGPINPHMLAIRSLSSMQKLSPSYLQRYLSYIDTVFWLEQAGIQTSSTKTKSK